MTVEASHGSSRSEQGARCGSRSVQRNRRVGSTLSEASVDRPFNLRGT